MNTVKTCIFVGTIGVCLFRGIIMLYNVITEWKCYYRRNKTCHQAISKVGLTVSSIKPAFGGEKKTLSVKYLKQRDSLSCSCL